MITISELKNLKLYAKTTKFLAPSIKEHTKKGSAIFLMSPSIEASYKLMQLPYMVNRKMFESYYIEKGIHYLVNSDEPVSEAAMSTEKRNSLKDSTFGIPELRKYPLNDEKHVREAIKKFNYVDPDHEKELAAAINDAIKKFHISDIKVGDANRFRHYLNPVEEIEESVSDIFAWRSPTWNFLSDGFINYEEAVFIANDVINESAQDAKIKRIIHADRIKNNKIIKDIYDNVKENVPGIIFTKYNLESYKGRNLFVDTYYYNKIFREKNTFKFDKGIDLYIEFMSRLIDDSRLKGYTQKTVLIPVYGWEINNVDTLDYKEHINPISVIYRLAKKGKFDALKKCFGRYDVVFCGESGYFKVNFNEFNKNQIQTFLTRFNILLTKQPIEDEVNNNLDSKEAIATMLYHNIQSNTGIEFKKPVKSFSGDTSYNTDKNFSDDFEEPEEVDDEDDEDTTEDSEDVKTAKDQLAKQLDDIADRASSLDDLDNMDSAIIDQDAIASLIDDITSEKGSNGVNISAARASRISSLDDNFVKKGIINGVKVSDLLKDAAATKTDETLDETELPINTINDEWKHMKFMNFEKHYNLDADITAILRFFTTRTYPLSILETNVEDTSNSEDYIYTWTVKFEDVNGTRFTMKFDVPKFINNTRFMRLRGNDKTINGQLMNIPIIKTGQNTCQITSNYNKIFIEPFGSSAGKSNVVADRLMKALMKNENPKVRVEVGDNSKLADKYELPIDYVDLGRQFSKIRLPKSTIYFNQEELNEKYGDLIKSQRPSNKVFPIGVTNDNGKDKILWSSISDSKFESEAILEQICLEVPKFKETYDSCKAGVKYQYSKCSILNSKIPLIVVAAYAVGLTEILKKYKGIIEYADSPNARSPKTSISKGEWDVIRFKDASIFYGLNYTTSMLFNGLKECPTEEYSIADIDTKAMWTDFLDLFGGRIKADGLDNFYDMMVDPITQRVCSVYGLPDTYVDQLLYANALLSDTKFNRHTDLTGNRFRTNELVAAYVFKCLSKAYSDYSIRMKKTGSGMMSMKQSAVIDAILADNTTSDLSTNSDLSYVETASTLSFKGLSGLNCDRSYGIDKRAYDDSMLNIVAMSTGFAGNVGVNRNATIDMGIESSRGYITGKSANVKNMNVTNTLSISEAVMPMSSTKDDPFRLAMSFIQNSKHGIASAAGDPCLVTTGADDALPYQAPDVFNYKAKKDGKVVDINDKYMTLKYKDGTSEVIELHPKTYKNSDGGFYLSVKLDIMPGIKVGSSFKAMQVLAYDHKSYSPNIGYDNNPTANRGILGKVAFELTDEGFEDSGLTSPYCCKALSRSVTVKVDCAVDKSANVYNMVSVGDYVDEGDNLLVYQNAYDDEDVNVLLRKLADDNDTIEELGRHPKKAKVTGRIVDIQIYRTCDLDTMSPTLKKIVTNYENAIEKDKKFLSEFDPEKAKIMRANYKLENAGKLKNLEDGVLIEFYLEFITDFGAGDKLVVNGGNKCVTSGNMEAGKEAYSEYRPNEPIDLLTSINSNNGRMITSNFLIGLCNKVMVELDREVKGIMGHKVTTDIHEYLHPEMIDPVTKEVFSNKTK